MRFDLLPMLSDNYAHVLDDPDRRRFVVVDPAEAAPVLAYIADSGHRLEAIWCTHHHFDHVGGNEVLAEKTGCAVLGSEHDRGRIPAQTRGLRDGETLRFGRLRLRALACPGHTLGALTFFAEDAGRAYTGDTLFLGGCGRLFEGSPEMMWRSLRALRALPGDTLICCGHEYTEANLRFAAHLEPEHAGVRARLDRVAAQRAAGAPTVPARLAEELLTNPFLRADSPELVAALAAQHGISATPGVEAFAAVRRLKDGFRG